MVDPNSHDDDQILDATLIKANYMADQISEFESTLRNCTILLKSAKVQGKTQEQRIAMFGAVNAAVTFVRSFDRLKEQDLHKPLELARNGLLDLKNGILNPLFRLDNPSNADSWETKHFKFYCSLAMEELIRAGMKRNSAAAYVASCCPILGLKAGRIADWRDKLTKYSNDEFSTPFQAVIAKTNNLPGKTLEKAKRFAQKLRTHDMSNVKLRNTRN